MAISSPADGGSGLVHRAQFGGGIVVQAERAQGEPVMGPLMGDGIGEPVKGGGAHDHGGVGANAAHRYHQRRNIQAGIHLVFEVVFAGPRSNRERGKWLHPVGFYRVGR